MDSIADSLVYSSGGCTCRLKRHDDRTAGTNLEFTVTMPDGYSISAYGSGPVSPETARRFIRWASGIWKISQRTGRLQP